MGRIDKESYYLDIAETVLERSTCSRSHSGALIVRNDEIVATGYNGAPRGRKNCSDLGYCVREQMRVPRGERYELCRSVHAEANAVLNYRGSLKDLEGSTVYVTLFPCHDCAKILAQVGVGEVVYLDNKYADTDDGRISRRILDSCGISYRQVIVDVQIGTGGQARQ
jgi:dCMP deaminase